MSMMGDTSGGGVSFQNLETNGRLLIEAVNGLGRAIGSTFASVGGASVSSVAFSGGTTGLTVSGSPITTAGTITLGGTLVVASGGTGATTAATARANLAAAGTSQTDYISGLIVNPANQDYRFVERLPFGVTLTSFSGKTSTGTLTSTLKINATSVTNGALAVTTVQSTITPTALNVAASGDTLVLTVSAVSAPANFSWTAVYTRPLVT